MNGYTLAGRGMRYIDAMTLMKRIGARLAHLRTRAGETQAETAAAIGLHRASIAGIETANQSIGLGTAIALADHFKVPLDYLLCREVPPGGPLAGQFVENLDVLALIRFWEGLDEQDRQALVRTLHIPDIAA